MNKKIIKIFISLLPFLLFSCMSIPQKNQISRSITGKSILTSSQLTAFFLDNNPNADKKQIARLSKYYIIESNMEGINSDVAFAQMCLETGYLTFGNLVTPDMHNYCGLGAIDQNNKGERFETEQEGVRAHIQHLHAYATTNDKVLKNKLIDKRYKWVNPRGKAPTIFELAGTWASDKEYGIKLDKILSKMEYYK